jgi:hypothetical protein
LPRQQRLLQCLPNAAKLSSGLRIEQTHCSSLIQLENLFSSSFLAIDRFIFQHQIYNIQFKLCIGASKKQAQAI